MHKELGVWQRNILFLTMMLLTAGLSMFIAFAPLFRITTGEGQTELYGYDLMGNYGLLPIVWSGIAGVVFLLTSFVFLTLSLVNNDEQELWGGCCFVVVALMVFAIMPLEMEHYADILRGYIVTVGWGYWVVLGLIILPLLCLALEKAIGRIHNDYLATAEIADCQNEMNS